MESCTKALVLIHTFVQGGDYKPGPTFEELCDVTGHCRAMHTQATRDVRTPQPR